VRVNEWREMCACPWLKTQDLTAVFLARGLLRTITQPTLNRLLLLLHRFNIFLAETRNFQ